MRAAPLHQSDLEASKALSVKTISLSSFRNYREQRVIFEPGLVLLTGANGSGKTNLLEAVSLLVPGRGLRRASLKDMQNQESPKSWAVSFHVRTPVGLIVVGTGLETDQANEHRVVTIDSKVARSQNALGDHIAMTWITPEMDRTLADGPGTRRKFLDRLVYSFDPSHQGRLQRYEKSMRERARLLREGPYDTAWLSALEDEMAQTGVALAAARLHMIHLLNRSINETDGAFPLASLALLGMAEEALLEEPALLVEDALRAALFRGRQEDRISGSCATGPHRSDLAVTHRSKATPAHYCSTGEQKALLITIILAHVRILTATRNMKPLLLLDDIVAHLDDLRRAALFDELLTLGVQAWLTGTDTETFESHLTDMQHYAVSNGEIQTP